MDAIFGKIARTALGAATLVGALAIGGGVEAKELTNVSLRLKWLASAQFIGYYVAKEKGWYEEEGLNLTINPGGPNIIAENMVASGADTFGHAGGAASLLQARAKDLPIVGIAMMFQQTPYRFVALPKSGIKKFSDLQGKTVSTWFTGPQFMLQGLLKAQHIPEGSVKIQAQPASIVPFEEGKVDVATVTVYNEIPVLKRDGITDLVMFNPAEMGVNLPNEAIIVAEKTAKEKPKLVQSFLDASLRGWVYALGHHKEAIDALMKAAPNAGRQEQEDEIEQLPQLLVWGEAKTKGIGYIDMKQLEFTNKFLVENGVIKAPVDVAKAVDLKFWENVPAKDKIVAAH